MPLVRLSRCCAAGGRPVRENTRRGLWPRSVPAAQRPGHAPARRHSTRDERHATVANGNRSQRYQRMSRSRIIVIRLHSATNLVVVLHACNFSLPFRLYSIVHTWTDGYYSKSLIPYSVYMRDFPSSTPRTAHARAAAPRCRVRELAML
jgi:hypothetical protein